MKYIIYLIRNRVNGKIYIGAHKTENINDGYMGSGVAVKKAIKKYGKDSFEKRILLECSSEESMYEKEAELVTEDFIRKPEVYNNSIGGHRGPNQSNRMWITNGSENLYILKSNEIPLGWHRGMAVNRPKQFFINNGFVCKKHNEGEAIPPGGEKGMPPSHSTQLSGTFIITDGLVSKRHNPDSPIPAGWWKGTTFKASTHMRNKMWITDGQKSKTVLKTDTIPPGWRKGRVM
jgi:hypothetical protein